MTYKQNHISTSTFLLSCASRKLQPISNKSSKASSGSSSHLWHLSLGHDLLPLIPYLLQE